MHRTTSDTREESEEVIYRFVSHMHGFLNLFETNRMCKAIKVTLPVLGDGTFFIYF